MTLVEVLGALIGPAIDEKIKKADAANKRRIEDMAVVK